MEGLLLATSGPSCRMAPWRGPPSEERMADRNVVGVGLMNETREREREAAQIYDMASKQTTHKR